MRAASNVSLLVLLLWTSRLGAKPVRVAFIGNSYTYFNDLPSMFMRLSASASIDVQHSQVTPGGSSLFEHGNTSLPMGKQTLQMLSDPLGWDRVVFQDQSETPGGGKDMDDGLEPGIGRQRSIDVLQSVFGPLLQKANSTAVFYSTWGRHDGDPPNSKCCGYSDFLSMNALTTAGYEKYANALARKGTLIASCGRAFELVYNASGKQPLDSSTLFSCLYHHGFANQTCQLDGAGKAGHPSVRGTYLISCVLFGTIHSRSPVGLSFRPSTVSEDDAAKLQAFAHDAVFGQPSRVATPSIVI